MQEYLDDKVEREAEKIENLSLAMMASLARDMLKKALNDMNKELSLPEKYFDDISEKAAERYREFTDDGTSWDEIKNAEFIGYDDFVNNAAKENGVIVNAERDSENNLWIITFTSDSKENLVNCLRDFLARIEAMEKENKKKKDGTKAIEQNSGPIKALPGHVDKDHNPGKGKGR